MKRAIVMIEGANFTDLEDLELLFLPAPGDPIETKIGTCIVTGVEELDDGRQYDVQINCRLP